MKKSKITILDLGYGNFKSLVNAFNYLNINIEITNDKKDFIPSDDLLNAAKSYSLDEDRGKIELSKLKRYMNMKGYQRKLKRTENGRIRGFVGLRIVDFKDIDVPF